jgi:glutaredoxin
MYVIIGKQKCIQCDELKNLLDEKGTQYNYLDMTEMPHKTMTYLRMYCNSFPSSTKHKSFIFELRRDLTTF